MFFPEIVDELNSGAQKYREALALNRCIALSPSQNVSAGKSHPPQGTWKGGAADVKGFPTLGHADFPFLDVYAPAVTPWTSPRSYADIPRYRLEPWMRRGDGSLDGHRGRRVRCSIYKRSITSKSGSQQQAQSQPLLLCFITSSSAIFSIVNYD